MPLSGSRGGPAHDREWVENGRLMRHRAFMGDAAISEVPVKTEVPLLTAAEGRRVAPNRRSSPLHGSVIWPHLTANRL